MNLLWSGLLIVVILLIANAEGDKAGKNESQYVAMLVSQGKLNELKIEENAANEALNNKTKELSELRNANLGKCDAGDREGKDNEKSKEIENLISNTNEEMKTWNNERDRLRKRVLKIADVMKPFVTKKNELTIVGLNLTLEGIRLQEKVDKAVDNDRRLHRDQRKANDTEGVAADKAKRKALDEQYDEQLDELYDEQDDHNQKMHSNSKFVESLAEDLERLSKERDNLIKKEDELRERVEAALGRLQKLEVQQKDEETKMAMEISQQIKECESKRAEREKEVREKQNEIGIAKKVLRMKEAKTRWMQKQVAEAMKKLEEMKGKKEQEEREQAKQIQ